MLTFKQRYRPRTTREYTKSDLTVYDSAGNTALNALTVYGKSEVVDGVIKSAGDSGSIEIETCEKNLIDITKSADIVRPDDVTRNGLSFFGLNGTYTLSQGTGSSTFYYGVWDGNRWSETGSIQPNTSKTISLNATKSLWLWVAENHQMSQLITTAQLEFGTTATAYEPYNGTMAVFETGTPLYGVSDTVRDVMTWDGSAGTVAKNCAKVNALTLTWRWNEEYSIWTSNSLTNLIKPSDRNVLQSFMVTPLEYTGVSWTDFGARDKTYSVNENGGIGFKDSDYDNTNPPDFDIIYELATPTTEPLTQTENESIANLRTFDGTTHFTNNAVTDMTVNYTIKVPTI